jgi:hypothetical protein
MAVVCISIVKRRFLEIIENISEVDNKLRYTQQEETHMNRKVMVNIISDIILLTVYPCILIIKITYELRVLCYKSEGHWFDSRCCHLIFPST